MNYRHHFHAGNFADVMKHVLLLQLLDRLNAKDKPYRYIDTHGGAGKYDLSEAPAQKSGEFLTGIHRLIQLSSAQKKQAPVAIQRYLDLVGQLREQDGKGAYPGSPWFAVQEMREQDKATIFEMQSEVFEYLRDNIRDKRVGLHERDAYEGLLAVIPPKEKRGLVMIDPPYEIERKDFPQLVELLQNAHKKWATGVFAVWYPIKDRAMIERFEKKMFKTGIRRQLICEICVWPDDTPVGLNGCGLLVINPPWQFAEDAKAALQWLLPHLKMTEHGAMTNVRWLVGE
ncbi:23S rRNA (adenine(2030)-N(6))-methyltransferase RlmJ [Acinetobacter qingfengensis]|uniref:Ribosomal RNA large subunit methyltransferase J n=1 Tax=Acinetobacter qingfengensis TaxID=1262585 RepID=A0A1E7RDV5_9GAMM|nr:23S rRNA (adenine(2030)-N(6))-methyltransferase RlmJ [Acinetobacter qingfengensis]KAA8734508.1 23S rRNA (adenine(2030)-N(6))-methyltransferase RlmJ [Acinetobacter qingfengensis]OEY97544.1 23S rRNA (adenine(2030)-N(6))-methyltransferase RlmJ [Acinetobacter qingfengensis]